MCAHFYFSAFSFLSKFQHAASSCDVCCVLIFDGKISVGFILNFKLNNFQLDFQSALLHIDELKVDFNKAFLNVTVDQVNDKLEDPVFNITVDSFVCIDKMLVYFKVCIPENENDFKYRRELVRTTIDVQKLFKGVIGNPIINVVIKAFYKSIDFEPTFPLRPVSLWMLS